jgi:hypothetical protein
MSLAPKYPPMAPAPTIKTRIFCLLTALEAQITSCY